MSTIKQVDKRNYQLLVNKQNSIRLPNKERTDTKIQLYWLYLDVNPQVPQVQEEDNVQEDNVHEQMHQRPVFGIKYG